MGKLSHTFRIILCGLLPLAASAQSGAPKPGPQTTAEIPGPPSDPSRYAGDKLDEYVSKYAAIFTIANRTTDPFGQPQDPDAKPVAKGPSSASPAPAEPTVPFSDIVGLIQITAIMSAEKRFLVGSRQFGEGDRFPVTYDGQPIWVAVTEVSSRQVGFKNLQTGEVAAQRIKALPPGMTPGGAAVKAPGMTPANPQAPLDLNPTGNPPATPSR